MLLIDPFISYLEKNAKRDWRHMLPKLRRGLGHRPGEAVEALPFIVPFLPSDPDLHEIFFVVGTLFGLHPAPNGKGNLGDMFRRLGENPSLENRFVSILNSHIDELGDRLRHVVSLAKSKNIPIDYRRLLTDLVYWTHPNRYVQLNWARSYWTVAHEGNNHQENTHVR